jgi:hypothetical protein
LAAVIWLGRVVWLAVSVSIAAWQAAGSGFDTAAAVAFGVTDVATADGLGAADDAAALLVDAAPTFAAAAPTLPAAVTVTVAVGVTVTVSVTVFHTVATGLAVVVGMSGTHWAMKMGSAAYRVCTPV